MGEIHFVMNEEDILQAITDYIVRARKIIFNGKGKIFVDFKTDNTRVMSASGKIKWED